MSEPVIVYTVSFGDIVGAILLGIVIVALAVIVTVEKIKGFAKRRRK